MFAGPLLATGDTSAAENRDLARALESPWREGTGPIGMDDFLERYPHSAWRPSVLVNLGMTYRKSGRVSKSIQALEESWDLTRDRAGKNEQAVANWALSELLEIHAHLGHAARLEQLFAEAETREVHGPATERLTIAREKLSRMRSDPEMSFRCGPASLARIAAKLGLAEDAERLFMNARATPHGMQLDQLEGLANKGGMPMRAVWRKPGAEVVLPAVMHWKVDHYSAILDRKSADGREYFLVENPLFEKEMWISRETLEEESSGYYLIPNGPLPDGWRAVSSAEAAQVVGRCYSGAPLDPDVFSTDDPVISSPPPPPPFCWICVHGQWLAYFGNLPILGSVWGPPRAMPQYDFHAYLVSLHVADAPLGYTPPVGPPVMFAITYNQRDSLQPSVFTYSNLGPKWTFDWLSYVVAPYDFEPYPTTQLYRRGGGMETYFSPQSVQGGSSTNSTYTFNNDYRSHAQLAGNFAFSSVSGWQSAYERRLPDGSKEIFGLRDKATEKEFLTAIADPAGNQITLAYDSQFRVVSVTDAIGQVTKLSYELPGDPLKVTKVTDPFGRSAVLTYNAQGQLASVTDVAGMTTQFTYGAGDFMTSMTTPYGTTAFRSGVPADGQPGGVDRFLEAVDPQGATEHLEFLTKDPSTPGVLGSSLFWDKYAWQTAPGDPQAASVINWTIGCCGQLGHSAIGVPHYVKGPLESPVKYLYADSSGSPSRDGEVSTSFFPDFVARPVQIAKTLDDGTIQSAQASYNSWGKPSMSTDPAGRQTGFNYDPTGIDLLEVHNVSDGNATLARTTYNNQHLPLSMTDAAGGTYTYTYNPKGQMLSVTNPRKETTAYTYDSRGYLTRVTGPVAGATNDFTYDSAGRLKTATDSEGYRAAFEYDALDRPTKITNPDGTFDQITYNKLDVVQASDRQGRVTQMAYDSLDRLVSITDPLGRKTQLVWCACNQIQQVIDPAGNTTTWTHDLEGRVTAKTLADGTTTQYIYEGSTGRLKSATDANGQTATYQYAIDDNVSQIAYTGGTSQTPAIGFTYDPNYDRVTSIQDGTGTTAVTYGSVGSAGALQIAAMDGPLGSHTAYGYDELGRVISRAIDGVSVTGSYDPLGRVTGVTSPLGAFGYTYLRATGLLASAAYPNGQNLALSYFPNSGDQRLQTLQNQGPQGLLSQFDYTYAATGEILTQARTLPVMDPNPSIFNYTYDAASQLRLAALSNASGAVGGFGYAYDPAGNRTSEQIDTQVYPAQFNNVNQLTESSAGQFTYDTNGNLLSDGTRTFEWDAEDRLTAVNIGTHRSEFSYDGLDQRTHMVEKDSGILLNDKQLIWCGGAICEERDSATGVTKRFFLQGETQVLGGVETPYFYTRDHLGSVREVTDSSGAVVASYDYDPWGRATKLSGAGVDSAFGYAGYYVHAPSGLYLTKYRAYDPNLGRWLSRDPIGETASFNPYAYVRNGPPNHTDTLGLADDLAGYDPAAYHTVAGMRAGAVEAEQRIVQGVRTRSFFVHSILGTLLGGVEAACNVTRFTTPAGSQTRYAVDVPPNLSAPAGSGTRYAADAPPPFAGAPWGSGTRYEIGAPHTEALSRDLAKQVAIRNGIQNWLGALFDPVPSPTVEQNIVLGLKTAANLIGIQLP